MCAAFVSISAVVIAFEQLQKLHWKTYAFKTTSSHRDGFGTCNPTHYFPVAKAYQADANTENNDDAEEFDDFLESVS